MCKVAHTTTYKANHKSRYDNLRVQIMKERYDLFDLLATMKRLMKPEKSNAMDGLSLYKHPN